MKKTVLISLTLLFSFITYCQTGEELKQDTLRKDALNVYYPNASSYLKEQIPYINYVRDRKVADLLIISAEEQNGSGGNEHTLFLEGLRKFSGMIDTLRYSSSPDDTYEEIRELQVKTLKLGLIRYVQKTPLSKYMNITFTEPISSEVSSDKWDSWVFRTSISGYLNGQSTYKGSNVSGNFSAGRVTEDWKINFRTRYSSGKEKFIFSDTTINGGSISKSANTLIVKSLNDHWSIGGTAAIVSSTYGNYDYTASIMPGIEYDIFPYSESTRRQLSFLYTVGYMYNDYTDTTIYNKTEEGLFSQSLSASLGLVQKWGSINASIEWSNHLRDFTENSLSLDGYIDWRVAKGLSINIGGSYAFIHDQISLLKEGASTEDILLRRKEMETSYEYFVHFGLSYTFGSIYNNAVNPRFGGSGGGSYVIFR
jgi:hypothetical protein